MDVIDVFRNGENVELIIHDDAIFIFAQRKKKSLIKSGLDLTEGIGSVSFMNIHGDGVELFEAGHGPHQKDNNTPTFNGLYSSAEQIGCDGLEILKN